jgi:hypothetical protein
MALVLVSGLLSAVLVEIYRLLNPPPPLSDSQLAAIYLHDAKLRLSAAESTSDPERAQKLMLGAEYDLFKSQIHTMKAEHLERNVLVAASSRKR